MSLKNKIFLNIIKLVVAVYGLKTKKKLSSKVENSRDKSTRKKSINFEYLKQSNLSGCINYDKLKEIFIKKHLIKI